jgi:meiotic recombination protein DMC1
MEAAGKIAVLHSGKFKTATQVKEEQAQLFHISTGSKEFDALLGGGVQSKFLTEVYGEFRTGKTQLCATLAVTAQLDPNFGGKVVFVDTEGNFSPERLRPICERFGVSAETVLDNIFVARVYNTDQQEAMVQQIEAQIDADQAPYSLVIIDSLTSLWRVDFSGRGELSERQQKLGKHLNQLRKLAERHNLAVVYSNQVMSDPSGGMTFVQDPKKPVGGHVVAHASNARISLRKGREQERIAKLVDHPSLPEADATFALSAAGVGDA